MFIVACGMCVIFYVLLCKNIGCQREKNDTNDEEGKKKKGRKKKWNAFSAKPSQASGKPGKAEVEERHKQQG